MQVANFTAAPNPRGGQIDLTWVNPDGPQFGGVKILRRELAFPERTDIGSPVEIHDEPAGVTPAGATGFFADAGLKSETVYYYAIIAYDNALPPQFSRPALATALTTASYQSADFLYKNLPVLYRRFDTVTPPDIDTLDPQDRTKGQMQRLLEMFGTQLDLLRSFASGMRQFHDVARADGALLPLLAQWLGWQTDFTLNLDKQRNEIKFAPHYYRTTGVAANLRAMLNRVSTWDVQIKEFVQNIFLATHPEQLTLWEIQREGTVWAPRQSVSLDAAFEGRPSAVEAPDGSTWLFYHALQSAPQSDPGADSPKNSVWHLWYKIRYQGNWFSARRLTVEGDLNKYPAVARNSDGSFWVFWTRFTGTGETTLPQIRLLVLAAGMAATPARVQGNTGGPFTFADGDHFAVTVDNRPARKVVFRAEHFADLTQATSEEVVAVLNREIPGAVVSVADGGKIVVTSESTGSASRLVLPASPVATALGLAAPTTITGTDASTATLLGSRSAPFALSGTVLKVRVDRQPNREITFAGEATAAEVAATINRVIPGLARESGGKVQLTSLTSGESSLVAVEVDASTAASLLGFGAPLPPAITPADETQPAVIRDAADNIWLFWSSRRSARTWQIWYNRYDNVTGRWGDSKPLTTGPLSDREPAVVFDPQGGGKIWVFWSRKKDNGLWNIFYRTTTQLDFDTQVDGDWTELELTPIPADHDRREPAGLLTAPDTIELFFSSNRSDGWHLWSNLLSPGPAADDAQITTGQFSDRAPVALVTGSGQTSLLFRSVESQQYTSAFYPIARTVDSRYAGSLTVDTRNPEKISLRKNFKDVQRYTYDTGKDESNWYARDTVGVYLTPDTDDQLLIFRKRNQIANLLRRFLPIQVRPVLILQQAFNELVYTYDKPETTPQIVIGEQMIDTILSEVYTGLTDGFLDRVDFQWLRTWSASGGTAILPDLSIAPPDLSFRLFLQGVAEGE